MLYNRANEKGIEVVEAMRSAVSANPDINVDAWAIKDGGMLKRCLIGAGLALVSWAAFSLSYDCFDVNNQLYGALNALRKKN